MTSWGTRCITMQHIKYGTCGKGSPGRQCPWPRWDSSCWDYVSHGCLLHLHTGTSSVCSHNQQTLPGWQGCAEVQRRTWYSGWRSWGGRGSRCLHNRWTTHIFVPKCYTLKDVNLGTHSSVVVKSMSSIPFTHCICVHVLSHALYCVIYRQE